VSPPRPPPTMRIGSSTAINTSGGRVSPGLVRQKRSQGVPELAASAVSVTAPSPLAGEGKMVIQQTVTGEGERLEPPSPSSALSYRAALSRKGRGHNNDRCARVARTLAAQSLCAVTLAHPTRT